MIALAEIPKLLELARQAAADLRAIRRLLEQDRAFADPANRPNEETEGERG